MDTGSTARNWQPGPIEAIGLLVIVTTVLLIRVPLSSDGTTYLTWYDSLLNNPSWGCAGFEPGFCVISKSLSLVGLPEQLYLKFWSLLTYFVSYLALRNLVGDYWMRQALPFLFLAVAFFLYLPFTITEHLTRQYLAGAILAFGLTHGHRIALIIAVLVAGLFHTFSLMLLPIAIALAFGLRVGSVMLFAAALTAFFIDWKVDSLRVLAQLFEQIRLLGEAWHNEYLKSLAYRFNLYWIGFRQPFGYPETSFRGIGVVVFAFFALNVRDRQALRIVIFMGFIAVLWFMVRSNDLVAHRVYHYIRELAVVPAVLTLISIAQLLPPAARRLLPNGGTKEIT